MINSVCVVGLGLIGGSFAKALKTFTDVKVFGVDISKDTTEKACLNGVINQELKDIKDADAFVIALYPKACVEYIKENLIDLDSDKIIIDMCGVKGYVVNSVSKLGLKARFIGGHPMAGKEMWGIDAADETLFKGASMIFTDDVPEDIEELFRKLGFTNIVFSTPEEHDKMIAFTSQLAHVISSAYVKIPSAQKHKGFSAGSFKDMTRVARLNEDMWTDLFLMNSDFLTEDISFVIEQLTAYRDAIKNKDEDNLKRMLREGRELKESFLE